MCSFWLRLLLVRPWTMLKPMVATARLDLHLRKNRRLAQGLTENTEMRKSRFWAVSVPPKGAPSQQIFVRAHNLKPSHDS